MQKRNKITVLHPVAVVISVPIEVDEFDVDGVELVDGKHYSTPVIADHEKAASAIEAIGSAVTSDENLAKVLDSLILSAKEIQQKIPGSEVEFTAWFGAAEFVEV